MYETDKEELLEEYEKLFVDLQESCVSLLEIGIWKGDSLRWARDFFPNCHVLGIDLKLPNRKDDRVTMEICDQNDTKRLKALAKEYGKFDIIIDDGSHLRKETKNCFNTLWGCVKEGGWYVIEDWDAYAVAPQYVTMTDYVAELLRFDCSKKIYFKNNKAFAAFQK